MANITENDLDIQAMADAASGDLEAFGRIICRHQNHLLNFFRRLGAYHDVAEDLVQETFLRLYKWRDRYTPSARFQTFLFTLARHVWVDHLRKLGRRPKAGGELAVEPVHPDEGAAATDRHLDVQAALTKLTDKLREVVVLSVYEGLNYREIGRILDIPEGTVKSRMFHALKNLREILGEEYL